MAESSTQQWQAERLSHWFVRGCGRSFAEHLSGLDSSDSTREIELEPREPHPAEWQAWEESLWFDLAASANSGALVSLGCSKPTAARIAALIAGDGEDVDARDTYAGFLDRVAGSSSKAVEDKLGRGFEFSQAQESACPENTDLGVEYVFTVQDSECVLALVPNADFLEAIQPAGEDQAAEKSQQPDESERAPKDEAATGEETLEGHQTAEEDEQTREEQQSREEEPSEEKEPEAVSDGGAQAKVRAAAAEAAKQALKLGGHAHTNLSMLLDIELDLSVSFGKTELPMQEVLKLASGSIVELNRAVSDPVEVLVNNCVIARGEVVVVEGNYGIRITEILSQKERIRSIF